MEESPAPLSRVLAIEPLDQLRAEANQRVSVGRTASRVHRIGEQRKMKILVPIPQEAHLQRLRHLPRLRFVQKQRRYRDYGQAIIRDALGKIELRKNSWREQQSDALVHDVNRRSRRRYQQ